MSKMQTVSNRAGQRNRNHLNLLLLPGLGVVEFKGETIAERPGKLVVEVLEARTCKEKGHTDWRVRVYGKYELLPFPEDWETGHYFPILTWPTIFHRFRSSLNGRCEALRITDEMIKRFLVHKFEGLAEAVAEEEAFNLEYGPNLSELLDEQQRYAEIERVLEVLTRETLQKEETERLKDARRRGEARVAELQAKLGNQSIPLADLAAAFG